MKNQILAIALVLLAFGCGVSDKEKFILNLEFKKVIRNLYDAEGFFLYPLNTEILSMKKYNKGRLDKPEFRGTISCEFGDGDVSGTILFEVGFDENRRINLLPPFCGTNKLDIDMTDIVVNNGKDINTDLRISPYLLDCFFMNRSDYLKFSKERKK